jgi:aldose 1-epimerase
MGEAPSGHQYPICHGDDRAVVVEVGAGLRSYVAGGRELLDGYAEDEMASSGRGLPLIPWPNRIRDGKYTWDGVDQQLGLSEAAKGNASHGLLRFVNWTCVEHTDDRVTLAYLLHPQPGYPFALDVRITYALGADGLTVTTTARNVGTTALPYASGQHPYLAPVTGLVDGSVLSVPGSTWFPIDERGIPTGEDPVEGSAFDFRVARAIGDTHLDTAYGSLTREPDGRAWVRFIAPDGSGAALWLDESYPYVQVFTADTVAVDRRRRGLAVEPMTAPANAFQTGTAVQRLEPGDSTTATWGLMALPATTD